MSDDLLERGPQEGQVALEYLKAFGQHRRGCLHPSCPDCGTHTMAASKTPGYSYCTRCGRGSIPTVEQACDCGFEAVLSALALDFPAGEVQPNTVADAERRGREAEAREIHEAWEFDDFNEETFDNWLHARIKRYRAGEVQA